MVSIIAGPSVTFDRDILLRIRLPRVFEAVIAGSSLSVAGVIFQGVLKNPLSDPYILGTSSGALLGAIICFMSGIGHSNVLFYPVVVFFAFGATVSSYFLARTDKNVSNVNLLLAGVVVSTFLTALVIAYLTLNRENALNIFSFVMGGFYQTDKTVLAVAFVFSMAGIITAGILSRYLDVMSLGDEKAVQLGLDANKIKFIFFGLAALITGCAVSVSGTIGFVGLLVPHVARLIFGPAHLRLLLVSGIGGAVFLILADCIARSVFSPAELPVGIITALSGAPFFLWLLRRSRANASE
ncbi:MAG: iron ABC transporter permease [Elusimicrobia bacterium]|nr:iron ABC transporter permease [Elusimicrobiota bacterium]